MSHLYPPQVRRRPPRPSPSQTSCPPAPPHPRCSAPRPLHSQVWRRCHGETTTDISGTKTCCTPASVLRSTLGHLVRRPTWYSSAAESARRCGDPCFSHDSSPPTSPTSILSGRGPRPCSPRAEITLPSASLPLPPVSHRVVPLGRRGSMGAEKKQKRSKPVRWQFCSITRFGGRVKR